MAIIGAPWSLNGLGFMHLFWAPKRIDPFSGVEVAGLGACMIVRYDESPVGPYNELLYIPGKQTIEGKRAFFISKIYVDSEDSMLSGQANWGIPKELADFSIINTDKNRWRINVSREGTTFFSANMVARSFSFSVTTKLVPIPLLQNWESNVFLTKFSGQGSGRFSKAKFKCFDQSLFADINQFRSLATLAVNPFTLTFPKALINSAIH